VPTAKAFFLQSVNLAETLAMKDARLAETYAKLGLCWIAEGNKVEAVKALKKGVAANPAEPTRQFIEKQLKKLEARN